MKILLLNKTYLAQALVDLGHEVITVGFEKDNFEANPNDLRAAFGKVPDRFWGKFDLQIPNFATLEQLYRALPAGFTPERIVYYDDSSTYLFLRGLERAKVPTVYFSIDAHLHSSAQSPIGGVFDHILVAQKDYISTFQRFHPSVHWFPLWARLPATPQADKQHAVTFVGSLDPNVHPRRQKFFDELGKLVPLHLAKGPYIEALTTSQIGINQLIQGDLNFRIFEVMACGAMLLTPQGRNGLLELFDEDKHLVTYDEKKPKSAAEKIAHYLGAHEERERIARFGRERVLALHTEAHRGTLMSSLLEQIPKLDANHSPRSRDFSSAFSAAAISLATSITGASQNSRICAEEAFQLAEKGFGGNSAHDDLLAHVFETNREHLTQLGYHSQLEELLDRHVRLKI